jgi:hypothetical protein
LELVISVGVRYSSIHFCPLSVNGGDSFRRRSLSLTWRS